MTICHKTMTMWQNLLTIIVVKLVFSELYWSLNPHMLGPTNTAYSYGNYDNPFGL